MLSPISINWNFLTLSMCIDQIGLTSGLTGHPIFTCFENLAHSGATSIWNHLSENFRWGKGAWPSYLPLLDPPPSPHLLSLNLHLFFLFYSNQWRALTVFHVLMADQEARMALQEERRGEEVKRKSPGGKTEDSVRREDEARESWWSV